MAVVNIYFNVERKFEISTDRFFMY